MLEHNLHCAVIVSDDGINDRESSIEWSFTCSVDVVLRHHFSLQLSWLLNKCSRVTLLVSLKYSIDFSLLCFIVYLQSFLIQRAYDLVHPHHWALLLLEMENMCLATIFTRWEGSARKDGSSISSSDFTLDYFRTYPLAPFYACLSTACIVLSSSATMESMIESQV